MRRSVLFKVASIFVAIFIICTFGCVNSQMLAGDKDHPSHGAAILGALGGAAAGAAIDKNNRVRGGIIGALVGTLLGETLEKTSQRAAAEAAKKNKQIEYKNGDRIVRATPAGYNKQTRCKVIINQVVSESGDLISENKQEVCEN